MSRECRNIYKIARMAKGYTQEKAAELLGISVESIRAYEASIRVPPNEVVAMMVEIYDHQALAMQHLRSSCALVSNIIPDFACGISLSEAVLQLWDAMLDMQEVIVALMRIGKDNIIHDYENDDFNAAMARGDRIIAAFLAVKYAKAEKKSPT